MTTTYTASLQLSLQGTGDNNNTWGSVANLVFAQVDQAVDGYLAIGVDGSSNVTLAWPAGTNSGNQANNAVLKFTGVLTGNIVIFYPATTRVMRVWNATSGAFTLTVAVVGTPGATVAVPQGAQMALWTDSANIYNGASGMGPISVIGGGAFDSVTAGVATISGALAVSTITGPITVIGGSVLENGVGVSGGVSVDVIDVTGAATIGGAATIIGTLGVNTISGPLTIPGAVVLEGGLGISGGITSDVLDVTGAATIGGALAIGNATASSATGGSASALPSLPVAYTSIVVGATTYKIPLYAV